MRYGAGVPRCLLCGANHSACGLPGTSAPVDLNIIIREESGTMAELAEYEVIDAHGTVTTLQLSEADAKRLGAKRVRAIATQAATVVVTTGDAANRTRPVADKARRPSPPHS